MAFTEDRVTTNHISFPELFSVFSPTLVVWMVHHESFSHQRCLIVFHWSVCDSKFPQVSRTLLSILVDRNNALVWMVSTCPLIFKSCSHFTNILRIVPRAPITINITVTFMFHRFFSFSSKVLELISLFAFFEFYSVGLSRLQSPLFGRFSFFCLLYYYYY